MSRDNREFYDEVLDENDDFFVIPALGSLVEDYVLIVSKRHVLSMCYLNEQEKKNLIDITNKLRMRLKERYDFFPIVFEHGASHSDMNRSACCVIHAHVHVVPIRLSCQEEMCSALEISEIAGFEALYKLGKDKPYISFLDNTEKMFFRDVSGAAMLSQIIRQWIARDLGTTRWDWRLHHFEKNIRATIDEFTEKKQQFKYFNAEKLRDISNH